MSAQLTRNVALKATRAIGKAPKSPLSTRPPAKATSKASRPTRIPPKLARARKLAKRVPKPRLTPVAAALRKEILRTGSKPPLSSPRNRLQKPSPTILGPKRNRGPNHEHGKDIWVYQHLQKNMIVYSLTKAMRNNAALAQIPFNGKKTVPSALRKDLWHPFARISFRRGYGFIGLSAFQKLREYRRRHELEWGNEIALRERTKEEIKEWKEENPEKSWDEEKYKLVPESRKKRGRKICDQKANSIADMAEVLNRLALDERTGLQVEIRNGRVVRPPSIGLKREGTGVKVKVLWRDIADQGFAVEWKDNVKHGMLPMGGLHENYSYRVYPPRKRNSEKRKPVPSLEAQSEAQSHGWKHLLERGAAWFKSEGSKSKTKKPKKQAEDARPVVNEETGRVIL